MNKRARLHNNRTHSCSPERIQMATMICQPYGEKWSTEEWKKRAEDNVIKMSWLLHMQIDQHTLISWPITKIESPRTDVSTKQNKDDNPRGQMKISHKFKHSNNSNKFTVSQSHFPVIKIPAPLPTCGRHCNTDIKLDITFEWLTAVHKNVSRLETCMKYCTEGWLEISTHDQEENIWIRSIKRSGGVLWTYQKCPV